MTDVTQQQAALSRETPAAKARALLEGGARRWVRRTSDYVDLQLSLILDSLRRVAPQAHGRLLDVGCGDKPYEAIFRPHVSEYIGVEHRETFALTAASAPELERGNKGPDVLYTVVRIPIRQAVTEFSTARP